MGLFTASNLDFEIDEEVEEPRQFTKEEIIAHNKNIRNILSDNNERLFHGGFLPEERAFIEIAEDPQQAKKRLIMAGYVAKKKGIHPREALANLEPHLKTYFDNENIEEAYRSALLLRGHHDFSNTNNFAMRMATEEERSRVELSPAGTVDQKKPLAEPFQWIDTFAKNLDRGTATMVMGFWTDIANKLGMKQVAADLQQSKEDYNELRAPDKRLIAIQAKERTDQEGLADAILNMGTVGFWATTGMETIVPNVALFGAGMVTGSTAANMLLKIQKGAQLTLAQNVGKTAFQGVLIGSAESSINAGEQFGEAFRHRERLLKDSMEIIKGLSEDQRNGVIGQTLIDSAREMETVQGHSNNLNIASQVASDVYWKNLPLNLATEIIDVATLKAFSKVLLNPLKGQPVREAFKGFLTGGTAAFVQSEQELVQEDIDAQAMFKLKTGQLIELDMIPNRTWGALFGDDPVRREIALTAMLIALGHGSVQVASDMMQAKSMHDFELRVDNYVKLIEEQPPGTVPADVLAIKDDLKDAGSIAEQQQILREVNADTIDTATDRLEAEEAVAEQRRSVETEIADLDALDVDEQTTTGVSEEPTVTTEATVAEIQAGIDALNLGPGFKPVGEFVIVKNLEEAAEKTGLTVEEIQDQIEGRNKKIDDISKGITKDISASQEKSKAEGFFFGSKAGNKIIIIQENIITGRGEKVVKHEFFHAALQTLKGDTGKLMDQVFAGRSAAEMTAVGRRYNLDLSTPEGRQEAAEEFLARVAEDQTVDPNLLQRIYAAVRQFLRDIGIVQEFTDADIRALIARSSRAAKELSGAVAQQELLPVDQQDRDVKFSLVPKTPKGLPQRDFNFESYSEQLKEWTKTAPDVMVFEHKVGSVLFLHPNKLPDKLSTGLTGDYRITTFRNKKPIGHRIFKTKFDAVLAASFQSQPSDTRFSIAPPVESAAFKKWFGNSKVVDENGKPLVVYHGTRGLNRDKAFTAFDLEKRGDRTGAESAKLGFFFASNPETANFYTGVDSVTDIIPKPEDDFLGISDLPSDQFFFEHPSIFPVFISLQNPFIFDFKGEGFRPETYADLLKEAQTKKHDGAIFKNTFDGGKEITDVIVAFEPTQIKSATGNVGTFDATNPDLRFSLTPQQRTRKGQLETELARIKKIQADPKLLQTEGRKLITAKRTKLARELEVLPVQQGFEPDKLRLVDKIKTVVVEKPSERGESVAQPETTKEPSKEPPKEVINAEAIDPTALVEEELPALDPIQVESLIADAKTSVDALVPTHASAAAKTHAYKMTMIRALGKAAGELVYGRSRATIFNKIRRIEPLVQAQAIDNRIADVVQQINRTQLHTDAKKLMKTLDRIMGLKLIWQKPSRTKEATKHKIDPSGQRWLKIVKQVYRKSKTHIDSEINFINNFLEQPTSDINEDGIKTVLAHIEAAAPVFKMDSFYKTIDLQQIATIYLKALVDFGAIQKREPTEIATAIENIQRDLDGAVLKVEALAAIQAEQDGKFILAFRDAIIPRKKADFKQPGIFDEAQTAPFMLHQWFRDIIRHGKVENRQAALTEFQQLSRELHSANEAEQTETRLATLAMQQALVDIYGTDKQKTFSGNPVVATKQLTSRATAIRKKLEAPNKKFRKYSKNEFPRALSKMNLLQIYGQGVQKDLEAGFIKNERDGEYFEELTAELSPQDMKLYQWLLNWYDASRDSLSEVSEELIGLPVVSPAFNYMPAAMAKIEDAIRTMHTSVSVYVKRFIERVRHTRDINEEVSALNLWQQTVKENARFKHGAKVHLKMTRIFSNEGLLSDIKNLHGEPYLKRFQEHIADTIAGGFPTNGGIELIDNVRAYVTLTALGVNPVVILKQTTSLPTFGLEIGLKNVVRHLSTVATPEAREAMRIIWNSDQRKNRFAAGPNEQFFNAIQSFTDTQLFEYMQVGMAGIAFGDIAPTLLIGQGIYRDFYNEEIKKENMTAEQAKQNALDNVFMIANRTQQSSNTENQALWLRRMGSGGRLLGQFGSATSQLAAHDIINIRELIAGAGDAVERRNQWMNFLVINHIMMPMFFTGMGTLYKAFLKGDIDEKEEILVMASAMLLGPMAGYIVLGFMTRSTIETLVLGRRNFWRNMLPIQKAADDMAVLGLLLRHMATFEFDEAMKDFDLFLQGQTGFYRTVKDAYDRVEEE